MKIRTITFLFFLACQSLFAQDDYLELDKEVFRSIPYRLLKPEEEKSNQKYPLVLFLHGSGERGTDNIINLKYITPLFMKAESRTKYPCYVVIPQCPPNVWWGGKEWGERSGGPADVMMKLIDSLIVKLSIDPRRIYVTGLSMGGYGTWYLLEKYPDRFAAAAPICGGGDPAAAATLKKVPLWIFHGTDDNAVPVAESRKMVDALSKAGGKPKYTEYPGVGHNSWENAYREPDFLQWLFSHKIKL